MQLEPLESRYTEQWSRWIPSALDTLDVEYRVIDWKKLTDKIEVWDVLDVYWTHYWKFSQMQRLMQMFQEWKVKDWDEIWFADLWFPWIEALAYIRSLTWIQFKVTGVLHAWTWDEKDFTFRYWMDKWAKGFEQTMFQLVDTVYVATEFHKNMILDDLLEEWGFAFAADVSDKIKVTGIFFDANECRMKAGVQKRVKWLVVFPHRLAPEKSPELFDKLASELSHTNFAFVKTIEVTSTKEEYYKMLASAEYSISFEWQETFGYSTLEAAALGCQPLVFNGMSYKETMPDLCRWNTWEELKTMLLSGVKCEPQDMIEAIEKYMPIDICKKMFL